MIDYHVLKNWPFGALRQRYDQRDVMLYALGCGLGADPEVARAAGFARPIFRRLGSFGMAAHAILRTCCDDAPEVLARLALRFTTPVYNCE